MNRKILIVLCISIFTAVLGQGLVVPLLPVYANSMGASGFLIGLIFGIFSISRSLLLPYFGNLSDKKGRKPLITGGLAVYFSVSLAFIFSHSVISLVLIRFFQGISSAMIIPVAQAYAGEITPPGYEGRIMSIVNISLYIGLGTGPVFGGVIKDIFGIQSSFISMGVVCFLGFIFSLLALPSVKAESINVKRKAPRAFGQLIRNTNIIGVLIIQYGYILCVGALWTFLPLIANTKYGMSSSNVGAIMSLIVFSSAILSYPIGMLADRMNKRVLVFLGGAMTLAGVFMLYRTNSSEQLYLAACLFGLGGGLVTPITTAMSAVIGKKMESVGSVMSLLTSGHSAGMFTGPLLAGIIVDSTGSINGAFEIGGIIFLILLVLAFFLTKNYQMMEDYLPGRLQA